jgi:hypothetical protein
MPAPIVIDVGDATPQRELAAALVDACTQAAAPAGSDCRLVRDAPNETYTAIAIVTWEEGGKARVEVGVRRDPVSEWRTRELTFQAQDAEIERFRSVGFVIGSLATASRDDAVPKTEPEPEPPKPPPPPPPPPPAPPPVPIIAPSAKPTAPPPATVGRGWIGLGGTLGGGLDRGAPRYGGRLNAGIRIVPHLAAIVSAGASFRARDDKGLSAQWLDAGAGLSFSLLPPERSHLELRLELLAEQFTAGVVDEGEHASGIRTVVATRAGFDAVLVLIGPLGLVLSGETTLRPATTIYVRDERAGATRNFELGAAAGLRLDL